MQAFDEFWENKLSEFETQMDEVLEQTKENHQDHAISAEEELEEAIPLRPKSTTQILNLRKILEHLSKQGDFTEAQKVKIELEQLEAKELESASVARKHKINMSMNTLLNKQEQELSALVQRIEAGRAELEKVKNWESDR